MAKSSLTKMSGKLQELFKVPEIPHRPIFEKRWAHLRKGALYVNKTDSKRDA